jgi:PDZ domain/Aspartyl protease
MHAILAALALVLPPNSSGSDVPAKPAAKVYQVPYRLTNTNHVLVRAKINGKGPYNFILDTGAPALFVSPAICEKLGIRANQQGWGKIPSFEIEGRVPLKDARARIETPFQLEGMNGLGLAGAELHGIIGYTVLAQFRLEFDFTRNKMGWTRLDFKPPQPEGLGKDGTPASMNALGSVMKILGGLLGKRTEPVVILRGFWGLALEDGAQGVTVTMLLNQGPAAEAGLQVGDRIIKVGGVSVTNLEALKTQAATKSDAEVIPLTIVRGGENKTLSLRAGKGL